MSQGFSDLVFHPNFFYKKRGFSFDKVQARAYLALPNGDMLSVEKVEGQPGYTVSLSESDGEEYGEFYSGPTFENVTVAKVDDLIKRLGVDPPRHHDLSGRYYTVGKRSVQFAPAPLMRKVFQHILDLVEAGFPEEGDVRLIGRSDANKKAFLKALKEAITQQKKVNTATRAAIAAMKGRGHQVPIK